MKLAVELCLYVDTHPYEVKTPNRTHQLCFGSTDITVSVGPLSGIFGGMAGLLFRLDPPIDHCRVDEKRLVAYDNDGKCTMFSQLPQEYLCEVRRGADLASVADLPYKFLGTYM